MRIVMLALCFAMFAGSVDAKPTKALTQSTLESIRAIGAFGWTIR